MRLVLDSRLLRIQPRHYCWKYVGQLSLLLNRSRSSDDGLGYLRLLLLESRLCHGRPARHLWLLLVVVLWLLQCP